MSTSTAYLLVQENKLRYSFDGVTAVSHALSLKVSTDSDSSEDSDVVNQARNEPDVVTLSVVASDANVPVRGWSRQMMDTLVRIKEERLFCKVVTGLRTYKDMLLTALAVQQDDSCTDGWTGTLTFTHVKKQKKKKKVEDQSSTPSSSGAAGAQSAGSQGGSVLKTILREAGIQV